MLLLVLLLVLPPVGGDSTPWQPATGTLGVEYRWSRPETNRCRVEVHSVNGAAMNVRLVAKFLSRPTSRPLPSTSDTPKKTDPTILRDQIDDRAIALHLSGPEEREFSLSDCYGVVRIEGGALSAAPAQSDASDDSEVK